MLIRVLALSIILNMKKESIVEFHVIFCKFKKLGKLSQSCNYLQRKCIVLPRDVLHSYLHFLNRLVEFGFFRY